MQDNNHDRQARLVFALMIVGLFFLASRISLPTHWPGPELPAEPVPEEPAPVVEIPDFAAILDVELKKQVFFDFLQPYIDVMNDRVRQQRTRLQVIIEKVASGDSIDRNERDYLRQLSIEYEMELDSVDNLDELRRLLRRVDVLPPSLVLAQAANESAWGTSRFALDGYNYFGQWCFEEGCGIVPSNRRRSASHEVKSFESIEESVEAYFMNLNTFPSYLDLRLIRQRLRDNNRPIDGISLSQGLESYSERGEDYINELRSMIYYNDLLERDMTLLQ
jgi:Bax protein